MKFFRYIYYRYIIRDWWEIRACRWPYPQGYATYNPRTRTILDTGLTRAHAKEICDEMNHQAVNGRE